MQAGLPSPVYLTCQLSFSGRSIKSQGLQLLILLLKPCNLQGVLIDQRKAGHFLLDAAGQQSSIDLVLIGKESFTHKTTRRAVAGSRCCRTVSVLLCLTKIFIGRFRLEWCQQHLQSWTCSLTDEHQTCSERALKSRSVFLRILREELRLLLRLQAITLSIHIFEGYLPPLTLKISWCFLLCRAHLM